MDELTELYRALTYPQKPQCSEFVIDQLARTYCRAGDVVVDAGANFGAHTSTFCRAVGHTGQVIAYEPHPQVAQKLKRFRDLFPWLTVVDKALSDHRGRSDFFAAKVSGWSSLNGRARPDLEGETITVELETLDEAAAEQPLAALRFIKIDVEGAELRLLRGATGVIRQFDPLIAIELRWDQVGNSLNDRLNFFDWISQLGSSGYRLYDFCGNLVEPTEEDEYMLFLIPNCIDAHMVFEYSRKAVRQYIDSDRSWTLYGKFT